MTYLAPAPRDRAGVLAALGEGRFDLVIIGGGAIGAATAWAAARSGARVAVVDRGDLAGATSSASTKLLHGGLRAGLLDFLGAVAVQALGEVGVGLGDPRGGDSHRIG